MPKRKPVPKRAPADSTKRKQWERYHKLRLLVSEIDRTPQHQLPNAVKKKKTKIMQEMQRLHEVLAGEHLPIPKTTEEIPDRVYHSAKRILNLERQRGKAEIERRNHFKQRFGFELKKIEHLLKK